ncbi:Pericentriolar material 1 protein [Nymphon striatum]|nr:Pericentriolar material 1 protein [Nymphon striatum]
MSRFLSHDKTKAALTEYLAEKILDYSRDLPKLVITSASGRTHSNKYTDHFEDNNHEETDTLMICLAITSTRRNRELQDIQLTFFSPDTDVLVLVIANYDLLPRKTSICMASGEIMYQNEGFRLNFICHSIKKSIVSRLLIVIEFKFDIVDIKMNEPCQKSTGAIKKKRIFHSTQIEEEKVKHNTMTSTTQLNEKVFDIISKILPFIKLHIDEPCQPKVLGSICKLTMTVTYEACAESLSIDSADLMQHQLKQILQDITFKYNGQRMKECIEYLLADISEVVYNILAYYLLLKFSRAPSDSASLSDKIKSVLESLESECAGLDFNLHSTSNGHSSDVIISTSQDCLLEISQGDKLSSPKLPLISSNPVVESMTAYVNQAPNDADCEEVDPKPTADTSYYNQEIPNGLSDRIAADVEPEPEAEPEADISNKDLAEADQSPQSGTLQCSEREQASNEVSDADKEFQSMCNGVCSPENTEDDFGMVASGGIDLEAEETDSARCNGLSGRNAFVNSTAEVSIAEPNEALSTESQQDLLRKTSGT